MTKMQLTDWLYFCFRKRIKAKYRLKELKTESERILEAKGDTKQIDQLYVENKNLLKFIILGANHVTSALFGSTRNNPVEARKEFGLEEKKLYIKFGKNALRAFEIYQVHPVNGTKETREKEMKDSLDHFAQAGFQIET